MNGEEYPGARRFSRRDFLKAGGVGLAGAALLGTSACGGGGSQGSGGPVTLTYWSWVPDLDKEVKLFEKAHSNIKVKLVNAGQGAAEYTKLRNAVKAGSGAPDVVQIEFQYIPTFKQINALADISQYGANKLKNDYVSWAWEQVSDGSKVYAIPQDSGPMGLLYRKDIFDKYGLTVPETWDDFEKQASKLSGTTSSVSLTDFAINDAAWFTGLLWQAGAQLFRVNGDSVSVNINDPAAMKVASYWQGLLDKKLVGTAPDFTNDWYSALDKGKYATWVTAAWGPVFLSGIAKESKGKWRAAPLPKWSSSDKVTANWGGSTNAVTTQSKNPKEAAALAMWINNNPKSVKMLADKSFLFPTDKSLLNSKSFKSQSYPFYGGQEVNQIFIQSSERVNTGFQWSPFQDYFFTQMNNKLGDASKGKTELPRAMNDLQSAVVKYAKSQGFKVKA
ncbi:MAG: ABC transporter substrate-binding protein [Rubrobacteraceae bacterium]